VPAVLLLLAAGCMPYVTSYVHVDAPQATYPRDGCGTAMPGYTARFDREGPLSPT
jgi:hypothetical protein